MNGDKHGFNMASKLWFAQREKWPEATMIILESPGNQRIQVTCICGECPIWSRVTMAMK